MNEEYVLKEGVYELAREFFCLECKFQYGDDVCPPNCSVAKFMDAVFDLPGEDVQIVHCKNCKHRPYTTGDCIESGFDIKAPNRDYTCTFLCDDRWYNRIPPDNHFCGYWERNSEGENYE